MNPHSHTHTSRSARGNIACTLFIGLLLGARAEAADNRLLDLSLEELLHVEITSAAKKAQTIAETAAAAFVITQDDIRRSGARSIPEVLRLAPGVEVAQIDGNKWAVSVRGFNGRFANKLLVLMDGRALYTPSFGGVFWDVQDTLMQDIERIEIIRGPGGAIWGANAVNGVINIITRSSRDSRGVELLADADDNRSRMASLRIGAAPSDNWSYRLYSKYNKGGSNEADFGETADRSDLWRFGARTDYVSSSGGTLSLTAEGYQGRSGESLHLPILTPPYSVRSSATEQVNGFFAVGRWSRRFEDNSELQAQFSFDDNSRSTPLFAEARDTTALEIQYHFQALGRHDVVIGSGLRKNRYWFGSTANVSLEPSHPRDTVYNLFAQDEIQIIPARLAMTLGVDLEHNPLSEHDVDVLPSVRLLGSLNEHNHAWVAVTRAISTPTYEQTAASVDNATPIRPPGSAENPFPVPIQTSVISSPLIKSERITAFELGYRSQIGDTFTVDATTFRHNYRDLRGEQAVDLQCEPTRVSVFVDPTCLFTASSVRNVIQFANVLEGHSTGVEIAADWAPVTGMRFIAAYTYLNLKVEATNTNPVATGVANMVMGQSPKQQFLLRSDLALAPNVDLYLAARRVGALHEGSIPAYWSADANLVWHVTPRWELSAFGHNLINRTHVEFQSELRDIPLTSLQRSVGLRVRWNY